MRLVHLSDLHLGFRQFQRVTPAGKNQREADVAQSFTRAIDKVIALAPDLVLIGGDVFHTVRPTNPAILHAFQQFSRLRAALPSAVIVIVAGNHDMPRSSETTCILRLFEPLGFHIADVAPRRAAVPGARVVHPRPCPTCRPGAWTCRRTSRSSTTCCCSTARWRVFSPKERARTSAPRCRFPRRPCRMSGGTTWRLATTMSTARWVPTRTTAVRSITRARTAGASTRRKRPRSSRARD